MNRLTLSAALGLSLVSSALSAHPHVFITSRVAVVFEGDLLKDISLSWAFDEMFSATILTEYQPGADGKYAADAAKAIQSSAFDNLANYHYFLTVTKDGKAIVPLQVDRFTPVVTGKTRLDYLFSVPLAIPVTAKEQTLRLTVYDDSYFVAFDPLHAEDVVVRGAGDVDYSLSVEKSKIKPSWPGQYMPDELVVKFRKRS